MNRASYGFVLVDRKSKKIECEAYINPFTRRYPGSAIKILIGFSVLRAVDSGDVSFEKPMLVNQRNNPEECTINWGCKQWGNGSVHTLRGMLEAMMVKSNNIAANELMRLVGIEGTTGTATASGAIGVRAVRKIHSSFDPEPWNMEANDATAYGFAALYTEAAIGAKGILKQSSRELLVSYLARTTRSRGFTPGIPRSHTFYHKTGTTDQVSVDGGFFYLDDDTAVILVGLQKFVRHDLLAEIGRRTYANLAKTATQ
jgi:beta-lactamase class A